ncbi:hypothetical protein ONZ45_g8076 [Pleurotus djamor]|nr:hypothetical protein ONZ45_g8076 [Pleurotus djamor]
MFPSVAIVVAAFAAFVSASPAVLTDENSCGTGTVQCCDTLEHYTSPHVNHFFTAAQKLGLIDAIVNPLVGHIGAKCTSGILSSQSCSAQLACCEDVTFDGDFAVGCTPIKVDVL